MYEPEYGGGSRNRWGACVSVEVTGPGWSSQDSGVFPGRFPLSVERHTMTAVDALVPGVTTVTLNAQYYALHALVADHATTKGMTVAAAQELLRRTEVAMCAISSQHLNTKDSGHSSWLSQPHGYDKIWGSRQAGGVIDVAAVAAPHHYAQPAWGFLAAYRGSEMRLRILARAADLRPAEGLDAGPARLGLAGLIELASADSLGPKALLEHQHLCLCRMANRPDGKWLARIFAGRSSDKHVDVTRRGTLRMMARTMQLTSVQNATRDLTRFVCFDSKAHEDELLCQLSVVPEWRGLMLRNASVTAWRDLWAWLVNGIDGLSPRDAVADAFADALPSQTVRKFREGLPSTVNRVGRPADAEFDASVVKAPAPLQMLKILALGAQRASELKDEELHGFQGHKVDDAYEELAPAWLAARMEDWADQPVRDFGRWLADVMVNRSQRLALAKARPDARTGVLKIPTRVHLKDDYIYRDSSEAGGPASLRLRQLLNIAGGMGLFKPKDDGAWTLGSHGDLLDV
jgi:hypothetical protein